jgi:hypothetical protein
VRVIAWSLERVAPTSRLALNIASMTLGVNGHAWTPVDENLRAKSLNFTKMTKRRRDVDLVAPTSNE